MPALTTRPVVAALRSRLTGAGLTVLDGGIGDTKPPCVVLWATPGQPSGSLGDPADSLTVTVTTVACGATADQAMAVADRVATLLNNWRPVVAGRTCHPVHMVRGTSVVRDDDITPPLWSTATEWAALTTP